MKIEGPLVDHHCHLVYAGTPDRSSFERFLTEADAPPPSGTSYADTHLGLAVRRWCAPLLDLPAHTTLADYLRRRADLGAQEVRRRLLRAAGCAAAYIETGIYGDTFCSMEQIAADGNMAVREVIRLEAVAEDLAASDVSAEGFAETYRSTASTVTADAIAVKSVLAYRCGFDLSEDRPSEQEVRAAAARWLAHPGDPPRLTDPVLERFLLWTAVDLGLPIQLHTGFGDRDLTLPAANPARLQPFLRAAEPSGVPIVLLHCYPYHREAGWLAATYPHVYLDCGLTLSHVGTRASTVLAEFCELAPFGKLLYSSDAYGLPELYAVGALAFRHALSEVLDGWLADDALTPTDAERIAHQIGSANADWVYRS